MKKHSSKELNNSTTKIHIHSELFDSSCAS
jgi:hypothetical protein